MALVSGHPEKAQKLAARYGVKDKSIYSYQNYDTIKDNPEIDVVYVVLPNSMHPEYTIRAHQAGKHVLSEKPMANTPADCQAMIDAAKKAGKKLMVAYRCRYEPFNKEVIRMVREQELGPVKIVVSDHGFNIGDPNQWRLKRELAGGGSLMDIGIYSLQAARYITGEEPTEVNAMVQTTPGDVRFKEVEETINFQLRFPSGALANCTLELRLRRPEPLPGHRHQGLVRAGAGHELHRARSGCAAATSPRSETCPQRDHFALEMDHMSECVMENKEPLTPGEEGLRDLKIMMAIYEAAKIGQDGQALGRDRGSGRAGAGERRGARRRRLASSRP